MIWFSCKQCGKKHCRPESQVGTMIFCDCGQGLRVPWSSTIAEPDPSELPPAPVPRPSAPIPPARPMPLDEMDPPRRASIPLPPSPPSGMPSRKPRNYRKVRPEYCLNHDETPRTQVCADCRLSFCDACVVSFRGQMLCSPCKNFRLRALGRPPRTSMLAVLGMIVGLVGGPMALCLGSATMNPTLNPQGSILLVVVFTLLGMLVPGGAVALCGLALREIERKINVAGRGLAMTGLFMGLVGVLWNLTVGVLLIMQQANG